SFAKDGNMPALAGPNALNAKSVRNLVLKLHGVVSITAAQDGKTAEARSFVANQTGAGSAFTVALFQVVSNPHREFKSWQDLFPSLRDRTNLVSGGRHQPRVFTMQEQGGVPTPVLPPATESEDNGPAAGIG